MNKYIVWLKSVGIKDVNLVGGKNTSLGEMIIGLSKQGVRVPNGFSTTVGAFQDFLKHNKLKLKIDAVLATLDINDIDALSTTGKQIRTWAMEGAFPKVLHEAIVKAHQQFESELGKQATFTMRSSATAEDLPEASFAGQ